MSIRTKFPLSAACLDDPQEVRLAELVRKVEPEPGELDADVRVELLPLDRLEHVVVGCDDLERLAPARDLLAEHVDRRHLPLLVERSHDLHRVRNRRARDVAVGDPAYHRARDRRQHADDGAI